MQFNWLSILDKKMILFNFLKNECFKNYIYNIKMANTMKIKGFHSIISHYLFKQFYKNVDFKIIIKFYKV